MLLIAHGLLLFSLSLSTVNCLLPTCPMYDRSCTSSSMSRRFWKPGNIGRTCVAWGRNSGWFALWDSVSKIDGCGSGMDYWQHLVWEAVDDWSALDAMLANSGRKPWFFSKTGQTTFYTGKFRRGDVLVFGSESRRTPRALLTAIPGSVSESPCVYRPVV